MNVGDACYRDGFGVAHLELPFRVTLPDGLTRTNPAEWSQDPEVMNATGWSVSTLTQEDLDLLFPPPVVDPDAWVNEGWTTPYGWKLGWTPDDVALLTGLYVLALRANQLGINQPIIFEDKDKQKHTMNFADFENLMLLYGAARASASANS